MTFSPALAGHGVTGTGNSGGGIALHIILAVPIVLLLLYQARKKLRRRLHGREGRDESPTPVS